MKRRARRAGAGLAVGLALLLAACTQEAPAPAPEVVRPVRTMVAVERSLSSPLRLPAEVRPRIETRYGFRVGGKLAERRVSVGDRVAFGEVLARLDPQDVQPAIAAASAALAAARTDRSLAGSELERIRELKARGFVSQGQLDRQQAALDAASARAAQAQAQLESARNASRFQTLRADVAGVVTGVEAEAGQVVAPGQTVVRVAPTDDVELLVDVPEAELAVARAADGWQVTMAALPGRRFDASLREMSPVADPATRSYPMRLALQGPLDGIALGMSAVVEATSHERTGIVVPLSALVSSDGRPGVWVVDGDSKVRRVEVVAGEIRDDGVRIVSGLAAGQRLVTAGANLLEAGQRVRIAGPAR